MKPKIFLLFCFFLAGPLVAQPVITNQPTNQTVVLGGNVTFNVAVSGVGPFTYQWQFNKTNLPNDIITTVAGNGSYSFSGDGGAATNASLSKPADVVLDSAGNFYIADYANNRIRKVNTNGVITTVAGGGSGGDGGAATNASLNDPSGVAVDDMGDLFIADYLNNRVRKVNPNGIITTVAGNGSSGYSGDGGVATNASLSYPSGVAVDDMGNLFIADASNNRIRKVDTNGIITTVAGNGGDGFSGDDGAATNASLNDPQGVAVDDVGDLFIADYKNNCIRKVDTNGVITTAAGGGSGGDGGAATNASLYGPFGIALDTIGNLYIAGFFGNRIRKVDTNGIITTVAGNGIGGGTGAYYVGDGGAATNASLSYPRGVAVDAAGNLYIADFYNNRIRKVDANGIITTVAGNGGAYAGDGGEAITARLNYPQGVAFDAAGNMYIADNNNDRVRKVNTNGIITTVAGNGVGSAFNQGDFSGDGGAATNASLYRPNNVAFDAAGNMYIADMFNQRIRKVDTNGTITTVAGNGRDNFSGDGGAATNASFNYSACVALDGAGKIYIADLFNDRVRKVDTNDIITTVAGGGHQGYGDGIAATNAILSSVQGVVLDSVGNFYVVDTGDCRIRKVGINGIITTVAGKGTQKSYGGDGGAAINAYLQEPWSVAFDAVGDMYIADLGNNRIRKVDTNGIITTVAGNGVATYSGDGGVATNASLDGPACVALDAMGNLYIADWYNNRIREVHFAGLPTLTLPQVDATNAGNYTVTITSPYGSVTSSNVTLSVLIPPKITTFSSLNGAFNFTWSAQSSLTYQVQYTTNLVAPDWIDLGSPITATSNSISTTDILGSAAQRFYRVFLVP